MSTRPARRLTPALAVVGTSGTALAALLIVGPGGFGAQPAAAPAVTPAAQANAPVAQTLTGDSWYPSGARVGVLTPQPGPPAAPAAPTRPALPWTEHGLGTPPSPSPPLSPRPLGPVRTLSATAPLVSPVPIPAESGEPHLLCNGVGAPRAHYSISRGGPTGWQVVRDDGGTVFDVTYRYVVGPWIAPTPCPS
ncbi:MAG: hypothetical protein JWM48_1424 [Mycobacterium sp.]|nr:hypothetical protein [Mycobacterium sp.]